MAIRTEAQAVPWWLRAYLIQGGLNALAIGFLGMFAPASIHLMLPVMIAPLGARFVAGLYLAAALAVLLSAFGRRPGEAAIYVIGFGIATGLLLLQTLLHWAEYSVNGVYYGWVGIYIFDPLAALLIIVLLRRQFFRPWTRHTLTWLFLVEAAILGGTGLLLLLVPEFAATIWPWKISPLVGQLYSSFFLTFAIVGLLAAGESRIVPIRNFIITSLGLMIFVLAGSLMHVPVFLPGVATWLWFGTLAVGAGIFLVTFIRFNMVGQLQQDAVSLN